MIDCRHAPTHSLLALVLQCLALSSACESASSDGARALLVDEAGPIDRDAAQGAGDVDSGAAQAAGDVDSGSTQEAGEVDGGARGAARQSARDSAIPSCGERLTILTPWLTKIDFGATAARGNWKFDDEQGTGSYQPPPAGTRLIWRGVSASNVALRCTATVDDCVVGGSRVLLEDAQGASVVIHFHWSPEELAGIESGTAVLLDASDVHGTLVLTTEDGKLLFAVVRYGSRDGYGPRSFQFGPIALHTGAAICEGINSMCNYLETVQSLIVTAGSASATLAPTERTELSIDGLRYQVVNHMSVQHGVANPGEQTCAAYKLGLDSITVLHIGIGSTTLSAAPLATWAARRT
jgi:hypothetical protein